MIADITNGHVLLSDWLFLIAFALFILCAVVDYLAPPRAVRVVRPAALVALALVALAWLVL